MSPRPASLSWRLRSLAAAALVLFVAAQAACFLHCLVGNPQGAAEGLPSCHASARPAGGHHDPATPEPAQAPGTTCSNLRTMLAGEDALPLIAPSPDAPDSTHSIPPSLDSVAPVQGLSAFRQGHPPDRAFTPEVRLGPAFRSLAPPFLG